MAASILSPWLSLKLWLFLFLWCAYGAAINSANLVDFNLQQAGVEAIVERKQFSIDGSASPHLQFRAYTHRGRPFGDIFDYNGHLYAAKQPGQFMAGALVYFFLHLFGLNYVNDYLLVSALVTFFTTALATALAAVAVFEAARELSGGHAVALPLVAALAYGLATPAFVYSGIAHHDQLASAYLAIAFYLVLLIARRRVSSHAEKPAALGAGLLLGLTLTTSVLPVLMVIVVFIYLVSLPGWKTIIFAALGIIVGMAPMLIYNAAAFGNPFLLPNLAGGYRDTFLIPNPNQWLSHAGFYVSAIALYVPAFLLGLAGLIFFPREQRREQIVLVIILAVLAVHVLNIETDGGCQYGPRYLLPAMPFACLGLIGFAYLRATTARRLGIAFVSVVTVASFVVSVLGAVYGAMYCETGRYALWPYVNALSRGDWRAMPLARGLVLPLIISALSLAFAARTYHFAQEQPQKPRGETSGPE